VRNDRNHRAEALLRQRRRLEEMARQDFVSAGEEAQRLRDRLSALHDARRQADTQARDRLTRGGEADTDDYRRQVPQLREAIETTSARLAEAERNVEHCRSKLLDGMRQRRAAELLRDRQAARNAAAAERRLARGRDEAYAVRLAIGKTTDEADDEDSL
jgi:flagellar export protein FliJ